MSSACIRPATSTCNRLRTLRHLGLAAMGVCLITHTLLASPQGAQVDAGLAVITQPDATTTIIEAANNTVINFQSFNIGAGEMVRFIQPSDTARVLNRVVGPGATQIDGSLLANGHVYIANKYGVFFGDQAIVNVGKLTAAAGSISNADFLGGIDRFSDLQGMVRNDGRIETSAARLIGQRVANYGTIVAKEGLVTMLAGDQVLLSDGKSPVLVKISPDSDPQTPAVLNAGTIDTGSSGSAIFGAADTYALAIHHTGTTRGQNVALDGGDGQVQMAGGLIDATNQTGRGGVVSLVGGEVVVKGNAKIDASGATGGGEVFVGGSMQGEGPLPNATYTYVGPDAQIKASATEQGDGGTIILWADFATWFFGDLEARAAGSEADGGFAEVSGKVNLVAQGTYDLAAAGGKRGVLLFDPLTVRIMGGSGDGSDLNFTNGLEGAPTANNVNTLVDDIDDTTNPITVFINNISFDNEGNGSIPFLIFESEIENALLDFDIIIEARNSITVSGTFSDQTLELPEDLSLFLSTRNDSSLDDDAGDIDLTGSAHGDALTIATSGTGGIFIDGTLGGDLTSNIILPTLQSEAGNIEIVTRASDITVNGPITSTTGDILIDAGGDSGSAFVNQAITSTSGDITIQASQDITFAAEGDVTTTSGNVDIDADADLSGSGMITMDMDTVINSGSGSLDMDAAGDIMLGSLITTNAAVLSLDSRAGGIIDVNDDAVNVTAPNVSMFAVDQIGTITDMDTGEGDAIEVVVSTALTNVTTSGAGSTIHIDLGESAGTVTGTINPGQANDASAILRADANLNATAGLNTFFTLLGMDNLGLFSGGTLTLPDGGVNMPGVHLWFGGETDIVEAGGSPHDLTFIAMSLNFVSGSAGGNTTINTTLDSLDLQLTDTGNLTVNETDALILNNATTADGSISVTTAGDLTATNVVSSATDDGSNDITLSSTGGNLQVVSVDAGSQNDATLSAATGMITDSGNTVIADVLTATAATGIQLNTTVDSALLSVTGAGTIAIVETNAIELTDVDTANGSITITAGGLVTATDVASLTDDDANDIAITAGSSGLVAGIIDAGAMGDVTLSTPGIIGDDPGKIIADNLMASAGTSATLDTTVTTIDAQAGTGTLSITETDDLIVTNAITTNGAVNITTGGSLQVMTVTAGGNQNVSLNSGGDISDTGMSVTGNALSATAQGGIQLNTTVTSATLQAQAPGDIQIVETNAIDLVDVDTADGSVDVTAGGTITATDVNTSATDDGTNDITLNTTLGDIAVVLINAGAMNDVSFSSTFATGSITSPAADGVADITTGDLVIMAPMGIGSITDFVNNIGNPLEIAVSGTVTGLTTTMPMSTINVRLIGATPAFAPGAIVPDVDGAASAIVQSGSDLDVSAGLGAFAISAGDSIGIVSDMTLTLPDGGLNLGTGNALLVGLIDIVETGASPRDIAVVAQSLSFTSGVAGGDTNLDVTVNQLSTSLTGSANLDIDASGAIELVNVTTADGAVDVNSTGSLTATNVDTSATDDGNNSIALTSAGDLLYDTINAGSLNDVFLFTIGGDVIPVGSLISGDLLLATIDGGADLFTDVNTINLVTTAPGAVTISETDTLLVQLVDTATLGDGDISITVLNSPMTVQRVNAGSRDVLLSSPTTIDNFEAPDGAVANVLGANINLFAGQIGMTTPLEVAASTQLSAQASFIDIRSIAASLIIGRIGAHGTQTINLSSLSTIIGQNTDYLPDLWGSVINLTALTADVDNASIGRMLTPLEVIATGSFNADTSAAPNGDIYVLFIGENKGGVINGGNFIFDNIVLSNVDEALGEDPAPNAGILIGNEFIVADDLIAAEPEPLDANVGLMGAGPDDQRFVPRRADRFEQLGGLSPQEYRAAFGRRLTDYLATQPSLEKKPVIDPVSLLAFVTLKADDQSIDDAAHRDSLAVLMGLQEIAELFEANGLFDEDHAADRRRTLAAALPGTLEPTMLDQIIGLVRMRMVLVDSTE